MMNKLVAMLVVLLVLCGHAWGGVVIEMVEGEGAADTIYAQGGMLRMDPRPAGGALPSSVVFRDDTLWVIDHGKKECLTIDENGMEELSVKLGAAMKQMEAQMAQLPPERREMMNEMMQQRMPPAMAAMLGVGEEPPPRRVEKSDASEQVGAYSCTVYTLHTGDRKDWEICAAPWGELDGAVSEAREAFQAMGAFADKIREAFKAGPLAQRMNNPFQFMNEIDGFPVRVRTFGQGGLLSESTLKSATAETLADDLFAVPEGYTVTHLTDEIQQGMRFRSGR